MPAVSEARYRKRMVRVIAKYFLKHIQVLASGTRPSIYREAAKPVRPIHCMISALNFHRSRRITSNYFLLLQFSHEENGAAD